MPRSEQETEMFTFRKQKQTSRLADHDHFESQALTADELAAVAGGNRAINACPGGFAPLGPVDPGPTGPGTFGFEVF
jgi:hypothetical protein